MTPPEKNVSHALNSLGINYKYEPTLFLRYKNGRESIRYPDFYIPHLDLYVEVRSLDRNYDVLGGRVHKKNNLYKENNLNWIEIDPAYTTRDGKRKLKSVESIYKDLQKKITSHVERGKSSYPLSNPGDNIYGFPKGLGNYKNYVLGKRYFGSLIGSYSHSGLGSSRYSSGGGSKYR